MRFNSAEIERRTHSVEFIKAKASLDAFDYVKLMRKKSPESLTLGPDGKLVLNMIEGRKIFSDASKTQRPVKSHFSWNRNVNRCAGDYL